MSKERDGRAEKDETEREMMWVIERDTRGKKTGGREGGRHGIEKNKQLSKQTSWGFIPDTQTEIILFSIFCLV